MSEPIVSFVGVVKRHAERTILDGVSFSISEGERVGVLGPNGAGKTTLLKLVVGEEPPDNGTVARKRSLMVGYVPQQPTFDPEGTAFATVAGGQAAQRALLTRIDDLRHALAGPDAEKATRDLAKLEEEVEARYGWDPDREVRRALHDMGIEDSEERPFGMLSGGEQRRVALARAIVSRADLLVLDEPTNHLDVETIVRLEERLLESKGTVIFVTHDRAFLDNVATRLIEIDRGALYSFEGTYQDYIERKAERLEHETRVERSRQNRLRSELEWLRRGPKAQRTKNKDRVARAEALVAERPREGDGSVDFAIPTGPRLGSTVVDLKNVKKAYGGRTLVKDLTFRFELGDRVGVVGKNGAGKTTLVKLITGEEKADGGTILVGPNTRFVHARQQKEDLDPELTVHQAVAGDSDWVTVGDERITVRAYLLRFLFDSEALRTKVGRLSGGERTRVQLARMLRDGGNFLVLDEPTNDLDLPTLRVLEDALLSFPGVALIVSHDRAFLGQVANKILGFEEDGHVEVSTGGIHHYLERRARRREEQKALAAAAAKKGAGGGKAAVVEGPKKLTWKEQKELEALEGKIAEAEAAVAELMKKLEDPALYSGDGKEARTVNESMRKKQEEVAQLYKRWEELEARR